MKQCSERRKRKIETFLANSVHIKLGSPQADQLSIFLWKDCSNRYQDTLGDREDRKDKNAQHPPLSLVSRKLNSFATPGGTCLRTHCYEIAK